MGGIGSDTQEHTALVTARPSLIARVNCIKVMKYLLLQKEKPKGRPEVLTNRVLAKPRTLLPGGSGVALSVGSTVRKSTEPRGGQSPRRCLLVSTTEATGAQKPPQGQLERLGEMCQELGANIPFSSGTGKPSAASGQEGSVHSRFPGASKTKKQKRP